MSELSNAEFISKAREFSGNAAPGQCHVKNGQESAYLDELLDEALDRLEAKPAWQPIETAPKDGTYLLLFGSWPISQQKDIWCGCWGSSFVETEVAVGDGIYRKERKTGWCCGEFNATHWMPLPCAPQMPTPAPIPPAQPEEVEMPF